MEATGKYEIEKKDFAFEDELNNDNSTEIPEFIQFPESAPLSPVKAGKITMILPWCC